MKTLKTFPFLIILFFFNCKNKSSIHESEIDSIQSANEVQHLIRHADSAFANYEVRKIQDFKKDDLKFQENLKLANQLGIHESFYKTDFDHNGFTDLLVIGDNHSCIGALKESCSYTPVVVLNWGNKKYQIVEISQYFNDCFVPRIKTLNNKNLLEIDRPIIKDWDKEIVAKQPEKQVLEYKYGDFIEYNSNDNNYIPIKKIEFSTSGCFGVCPAFQLVINKDQNAIFIAERFNFDQNEENPSEEIEGKFHTKIKNKDYQELITILEYIDFPNLQDEYSVDWTDDQTVVLKITYGNGKVKVITDYGASGTYGLKKIYKILFNMRKNQNWMKE
ncbi:DUF6438 domain-containing protein [Chryseobacterium sp. CT-SW4]|uniref:DUF6438 domain-containing protein n=1 Tax=Chryseobacterium sp. SW-1 TaxID=3157343 RepID=UPI003B028D50